MATAEIVYLGNLRTEVTHVQSNTKFYTDAPLDNKGRGAFISPTDLVAAALGGCMETIVGIYCQEREIRFEFCTVQVTKIMGSAPRRITELHVLLNFVGNKWDNKVQKGVKAAAEACPVAKSIHPDILLKFDYRFD
jgi:uncharacterized OsmC-like protein